jgi:hypothetical protein
VSTNAHLCWQFALVVDRSWLITSDNCVSFFYNQGLRSVYERLGMAPLQILTFLSTVNSNRVSFIPGICANIQAFHTANGLQNGQLTLTYASNDGLSATRGTQSCPGSFCATKNTMYSTNFGIAAGVSSCDEFPFRSTEEGGSAFYGLARNGNPTGVQSLCVPVWQVRTTPFQAFYNIQ